MTGPSERDEIAAHPVIGAETPRQGAGQTVPELQLLCYSCGWMSASDYHQHLTDLLAERDRRTAAKTLREAARKVEWKFRAMTFYRHGESVTKLHGSGHFLREMANEIEGGA